MPSSIIHIIPSAVFINTYHGSYKDVISRVRYFETFGLPYRQIRLKRDDPALVLDTLKDVSEPAVLIEYCSFPHTLKALRRQFLTSPIGVRAHNIEPLQHLDNHGCWPARGPLWLVFGMMRLFRDDLLMKRHATAIYSISDWENGVYWERLPGRARVEWLPYFCPDHLIEDQVTSTVERRRIVCLPTSQKNRKSWDLVARFITFAERMKAITGDQYDFLITGDLADWGLPPSRDVQFTGMIDDLQSFLQTIKAVAMLSNKGYGFKTTVADAIANGAMVLAHPGLAARCPKMLQSSIIAVNIDDEADIASTSYRLQTMQGDPELNRHLRDNSLKTLRKFCSPFEALNVA